MTVAPSSVGETDSEATRALRIIESMPGHAWSADAAGRFTYVSPSTLAFLGRAAGELAASEGGNEFGRDEFGRDEFGWGRAIHPDDYDRATAAWRHCLETGEPYETEHRLRRADGVYRWFRNSGRPARDSQGHITQWFGTTIDIDDQKRAEAALRDRERELSQLVNMVPSHLWRLTPDGEPIFFSKRMVDFIGFDVADIGKPGMSRLAAMIEAAIHPDDATAFNGALGRCLVTGERFSMRYRLRRADGVYHWMSSRAEPLRDHGGRIVQWYGLCHDVDDQMHAEEALRRSERQLQQMIDAVPVRAFSTAPTGGSTYFNKRYEDYLRSVIPDFDTLEEPRTSKLVQDLLHPDDAREVTRRLRNCFETGEAFMMRYRRRGADGAYHWAEGRMEPLRGPDGAIVQWYGINLDVDDEVRAQDALRDRERELSQLVDMVPSFLWRLSPDGEPTFLNKRLVDFFGLDPADAGKPETRRLSAVIEAIAHPDDAARLAEALRHSLTTGHRLSMRYRLRRADGVYRWMEGRAEPLRDQDGRIVQWYGLTHDIDDQLRVEEALRESERSLRQLVETLPALIYCAAPDGKPIYRSEKLREFLGIGLPDSDGPGPAQLDDTLEAIIHPDDLATVRERYAHSLSTGVPYALKHRLRRFDGAYCWVETRAAAMRNAEGAIVQWNGVCLDIEDQVRAQEALRLAQENLARASQAASLAELSASIAHEVNQPLAAVVTNSHACRRWLAVEPPNLERARITAERITRDANAAAEVVSRVRSLFKQTPGPRTCARLSDAIAETRDLLAEEAARRSVRLEVEIESDLPLVAFDRIQIQQVLINLVRNGMEAMDSATGSRILRMRVRRVEGAIRTEIHDRGPGIAFPDKIFESFFTTKEHGMGMGLAICQSIIESHGGRLWAENGEPRGATFVFTLPIETEPA